LICPPLMRLAVPGAGELVSQNNAVLSYASILNLTSRDVSDLNRKLAKQQYDIENQVRARPGAWERNGAIGLSRLTTTPLTWHARV
jgi:hypothetical protein